MCELSNFFELNVWFDNSIHLYKMQVSQTVCAYHTGEPQKKRAEKMKISSDTFMDRKAVPLFFFFFLV